MPGQGKGLDKHADKFFNDKKFREEVLKNPAKANADHDLGLTDEQVAAIGSAVDKFGIDPDGQEIGLL